MRISTHPTASRFFGAAQATLDAGDALVQYSSATKSISFAYDTIKTAALTHGVIWHGLQIKFTDGDRRPLAVNGLTLEDALGMQEVLQRGIAQVLYERLEPEIRRAMEALSTLCEANQYVDDRQAQGWRDANLSLSGKVPSDFMKLPVDSETKDQVSRFLSLLQRDGLREYIDNRNQRFVEDELVRWKDFFDSVEKYPLTQQQREAIVADECNNLVIAGAGTGKTSTLLGKVGYLLSKGLATTDEILLLAFANDAAKELQTRIRDKFRQDIEVRTFHSFGMHVISSSEVKPSVSKLATDQQAQEKFILSSLTDLLKDRTFSQRLSDFFRDHLKLYKSRFSFRNLGEYFDYLRTYDVRTLKGERVKSHEECLIANYLTLSGIEYEYERPYEHPTATKDRRQYKPDFYLSEHGIYIEHFAIDRKGRPPSFFDQADKARYVEDMEWKRKLHLDKETRLIETFSYEADEGKLIENLRGRLIQEGVGIKPISPEEFFEIAKKSGYINRMTDLLGTFVHLFKASQLTIGELYEKAADRPDKRRAMAFLELFEKIHERYQAHLTETGEIDFDDMIGKATHMVREGVYKSPFKYILVDEFQDISLSRHRLVKALLDQDPSQKVVCVGDDWQSIYRFSGSDLSIMVDFEKYFGFTKTSMLEKTFRFEKGIMDFSSKFILRNPRQIRKQLTSDMQGNRKPVKAIIIDNRDPDIGIRKALAEIAADIGQGKASVFILGRYRHEVPKDMSRLRRDFSRLLMRFYTVHRAKGLEADFVIIPSMNAGRLGFPCGITDDPILDLVLAGSDNFDYAEERRLFYVALTRAKRKVFLIADRASPSVFVTEIIDGGYEVETDRDVGLEVVVKCPRCMTGTMTAREGEFGRFVGCSNWPYCDEKAKICPACSVGIIIHSSDGKSYRCSSNDCSYTVPACPVCHSIMVIRKNSRDGNKFYGCSKYPECKGTRSIPLPQD